MAGLMTGLIMLTVDRDKRLDVFNDTASDFDPVHLHSRELIATYDCES